MTTPNSVCHCCSARTNGGRGASHCAACAGRHGLAVVLLAETPSTGYRWLPAGLPDDIQLITEDFLFDTRSDAIGQQGAHLFVLRGPPATRRNVRWRLQREWKSESVEELELDLVFESHAAAVVPGAGRSSSRSRRA